MYHNFSHLADATKTAMTGTCTYIVPSKVKDIKGRVGVTLIILGKFADINAGFFYFNGPNPKES